MTARYNLKEGQDVELVDGAVPSNFRVEVVRGRVQIDLHDADRRVRQAFAGSAPRAVPAQDFWHYAAYRAVARAVPDEGGAEIVLTIQRA